eukprot:gene16164-4905_t
MDSPGFTDMTESNWQNHLPRSKDQNRVPAAQSSGSAGRTEFQEWESQFRAPGKNVLGDVSPNKGNAAPSKGGTPLPLQRPVSVYHWADDNQIHRDKERPRILLSRNETRPPTRAFESEEAQSVQVALQELQARLGEGASSARYHSDSGSEVESTLAPRSVIT